MNFIEWLESLDPDDAKLVLAIRKGEIPYPGMSRHVAKKAFPDIAGHFR